MLGHWLRDLKILMKIIIRNRGKWKNKSLAVIINVINIDLNKMIVIVPCLMCIILSLCLAFNPTPLNFIILDPIAVIILPIILCLLLISWADLIIYHLMVHRKCFIDTLLIIIIDIHRTFIINNL